MKFLQAAYMRSPIIPRALPFAVFLLLTFAQEHLGEAARYWMYALKTGVGAWLIWTARRYIVELRWSCSWEAVAAGVAVFALWVGLDPYYPKLSKASEVWNPHIAFGQGSPLAWTCIAVRILGSGLVVPPLEEVFYRSFLYRYIEKQDFVTVPVGFFSWTPFLVTSAVFGLAHREWLAGVLCGLIYQGLVCRKQRLGDALTAHAITNVLLGLWVTATGAWQFW
jgi:CAAX prenyl protease-like protein